MINFLCSLSLLYLTVFLPLVVTYVWEGGDDRSEWRSRDWPHYYLVSPQRKARLYYLATSHSDIVLCRQELRPAIILNTTNYVQSLCVRTGLAAEVAGKVTYTGQQSPDIPHSSQVRFDWNVFLCPTKYNNVRQYQTMFRKNFYFVTIARDYRSHNMVCFWWKILPNVYLRQKRNPSLWLIWKWLIKSVIACVTNSQQLQVFVTIYCAKKEVWDVITDTMIHSHFQYPALQRVLNRRHCSSSSAVTRSQQRHTTFTVLGSVLVPPTTLTLIWLFRRF